MSTGIRLTFDYVKEYFHNQGCELLETEYRNARTKMKYKCVCGNETQIVFDSFRRGNRCWDCGRNKVRKRTKALRLSHAEVSQYFTSQNCELLDVYEKSCIVMHYRCSCGNLSKTNFNNFKRGRRCKECLRVKRSGPNNYQWIPDRIAKREYDLFKQRCYKMLKIALNATGQKKNSRTEKMLGYTIKEFQERIKNHPNYLAVQNQRWHLDHIFPIKAFVDYGVDDVKIINGLDNLQPLLYNLNISKSGKYDSKQFEKWLLSKNIKPRRVK